MWLGTIWNQFRMVSHRPQTTPCVHIYRAIENERYKSLFNVISIIFITQYPDHSVYYIYIIWIYDFALPSPHQSSMGLLQNNRETRCPPGDQNISTTFLFLPISSFLSQSAATACFIVCSRILRTLRLREPHVKYYILHNNHII